MGEENSLKNSKLSKIKHHIVHHSQKVKHHIHKHHKKYISGSVLYVVSHVLILKVLALKLFVFKIFIAGLAFLGIYNHPMTDIFADMENLCINGKPMIAQETCQKNFTTIQEAVAYIEGEVNPETDTIYNASHYSLLKSILREYCGPKIDRNISKKQRTLFRSISKIKDSQSKITYLKKIYDSGYNKSKEPIGTGEKAFCRTKYETYNMLDMSKKAFIRELKKKGLLETSPLLGTGKKSDLFILSSFRSQSKDNDKSNIKYTLPKYENSKSNEELATITKNITIRAVNDAMNLLGDNDIITDKELKEINKNFEIVFNPSCDKNTGFHKINQYLNEKNEVVDASLEKLQLNINLCKSYQYIDELSMTVSKLLIHEIGHYVYNFKDKTISNFESICRNKQSNKCSSDDFVTRYSQTNSEEDYAETFSRRALAELKNDKRYLSFYKKSDVVNQNILAMELPKLDPTSSGVAHGSAIRNTIPMDVISQKFTYFDRLLSKSSKVSSLK